MAKKLVGSQVLARALNVSGETIRYHARQGRIPFAVTPGGHRRFDIDEVKEALGMQTPKKAVEATGVMIDIDLSEPHREMREETRGFFAMSAGRDEAAFIHDHEKLSPSAPLARFVKEATARYAPAKTFAGAGLAAR